MPRPLSLLAVLILSGWACATAEFGDFPDEALGDAGAPGDAGVPSAGLPPTGGSGGGTQKPDGPGGVGLASNEFGSENEADDTLEPACDYGAAPTCDFTRLEGCCMQLACERASGADVFNTYPVESCQNLLACVEAHPGCSSASDPLCFGSESPSAPCLQEGYQASHLDPEGPFAWTATLVRCLCGY